MAKLTLRHKNPEFRFNKIKVINSDKGNKIRFKYKLISFLLILSVCGNIYLVHTFIK